MRKRFSGFYRFKRFNGGGAAHKNMEAPLFYKIVPPRIVIPSEALDLSCIPVSSKYEIAEQRSSKTSFMKWRIHADFRTAIKISRLRSK